jgi:hypothetical protein
MSVTSSPAISMPEGPPPTTMMRLAALIFSVVACAAQCGVGEGRVLVLVLVVVVLVVVVLVVLVGSDKASVRVPGSSGEAPGCRRQGRP